MILMLIYSHAQEPCKLTQVLRVEPANANELAGEPIEQPRRVVGEDYVVDVHPDDHDMPINMLHEEAWIKSQSRETHVC